RRAPAPRRGCAAHPRSGSPPPTRARSPPTGSRRGRGTAGRRCRCRSSRSDPGPLVMERGAAPGVVHEDLRRTEALAVMRGQPLQHLRREARAELVEIAERPAAERREAETEDRADVAVAGRAQYAFLQTPGRLVEEREDEPVLDVAHVERASRGSRRQE